MKIRPSLAALNSRGKYAFIAPSLSLDHLVVGGGIWQNHQYHRVPYQCLVLQVWLG